jgi:AraC-like DNA-binding protein
MQTYDVTPLRTRLLHQRGQAAIGRKMDSGSKTNSCRIDYCEPGRQGWGEMFWLHSGALAEVYEWRIDAERQHILTMSDCLLALFSLCGACRLSVDGCDSLSINEPQCLAVLARDRLAVTRTFDAGYGQEIAVLVPLVVLERRNCPIPKQTLTSTVLSDRMVESARAMLSTPSSHPLRDACVESHAWLLLGELLSSPIFLPKPLSAQSAQCRTRILANRAAELLRAKPEFSHTLDSVARAVGLSRSRLAQVFHQQYGSTVQAYLREIRMEKASKLIRIGQLAISEVALRVGYQDVSSFTRTFHRFHRMTPAAMRRQHTT